MNIQTLQEFVTLSRHLKISSAANELFVSAPTLSQHITAMEKELGITLFERKGGLSLTGDGEDALEIAQRILREYERLSTLSAKKDERVRMRIPNYYVGLGEFLQAKQAFLEENPSCTVSIETNELQMSDPFAILKERKSDVAVLYLTRSSGKTIEEYVPADGTVSFFPLRTLDMVFESTLQHPLADKDILSLEDFDGETIATTHCPLAFINADCVRRFFEKRGVTVHVMTRHLGRHDDIFATDFDDCLVSRFAGQPNLPAYEAIPRHRYKLDFDLVTDAYLLYRPDDLSALQLSYLQTVQQQREENLL